MFAAEAASRSGIIWLFEPLIDLVIPEDRLADLPDHVVRKSPVRAEHRPDERCFVLLPGDAFMNHSDWAELLDQGDFARAAAGIEIGNELKCGWRRPRKVHVRPDYPSREVAPFHAPDPDQSDAPRGRELHRVGGYFKKAAGTEPPWPGRFPLGALLDAIPAGGWFTLMCSYSLAATGALSPPRRTSCWPGWAW